MTMNMNLLLSGHYTLTVLTPDLQVVEEREFDNLITNVGLDRWASGGIVNSIGVGSGTTAPAFTDSALEAPLAVSTTRVPSSTAFSFNETLRTQTITTRYRFAPGSVTGQVSEVGALHSTFLWSRALVTYAGNPSPITITPDYVLDVTYTLTIQYPADVVFPVFLDGTATNCTVRPAYLDDPLFRNPANLDGVIPNILQGPLVYFSYMSPTAYSGGLVPVVLGKTGPYPASGAGTWIGDWSAPALEPYVAGSYYRDIKVAIGIDSLNHAAGIGTLYLSSRSSDGTLYSGWQINLDPPLFKTAAYKFNMTLRLSWARG